MKNQQSKKNNEEPLQNAHTAFCKDCGSTVNKAAEICPSCGVRQKVVQNIQTVFCKDCGERINKNAEICPSCGVRQTRHIGHTGLPEQRSRIIAILLALFLGGFGIHKFYLGRTTAGVLYLIFFWTFIPAILSLIDLIILIIMTDEKFSQEYCK